MLSLTLLYIYFYTKNCSLEKDNKFSDTQTGKFEGNLMYIEEYAKLVFNQIYLFISLQLHYNVAINFIIFIIFFCQ